VQSVELLTVTDHAAVFQIVQTITSFAWTAFGELAVLKSITRSWLEPMRISDEHFKCQCIYETHYGVQEGLTHFGQQPSRVALVYAAGRSEPLRIYDPLDLLLGHEPKFKELFVDNVDWRRIPEGLSGLSDGREMREEANLDLTGLISWGGRSRSIFYQMWFAEHHPDMCHVGPTERWLDHAGQSGSTGRSVAGG
jgi:hypothetical protein